MKKIIEYTGFTLLFLAGIVILGHSIIPHHHHLHAAKNPASCEHSCNHQNEENSLPDYITFDNTNHDEPLCEGCHFTIEVTNPFENFFVDFYYATSLYNFHFFVPENETEKSLYACKSYQLLFYTQLPNRGPPSLS